MKELKLVKVDRVEEWEVKKYWIKESNKVLSTLEGVYSREWYMGKRRGLRKYKRNNRWIQEKNK